MLANNEFIEHASIFGKNYGTTKAVIEKILQEGCDVILEIDWQGAQHFRKTMPDTTSIFILPPSKETLRQRILNRNQDNEAVIEKRLKAASSEIAHYPEFDYLIVNDNFDDALSELKAIIQTQRCKQTLQSKKLKNLLIDLGVEN